MLNRIVTALESRRYRLLNKRDRTIAWDGGVVSFTFDDFPESATAGARLLEARDWRGTFYMATAVAGQDSAVGRIATFDSARELHAAGHEIGNHTHSHLRCNGAKKSVLRAELTASSAALKSMDGNRSFALPFGAYDASALNVLSGRFDTIRTVQKGVNAQQADLNLLKANPIYRSIKLEAVEALLQEVREKNGWLIFYTHDVCEQPSEFGCTPEQFDQVLALVAERGLPVKTVSEVFASL